MRCHAPTTQARKDRHQHVHARLGRRRNRRHLRPAAGAFDVQRKGDGDYNYGRYSNAKLDELTAKVKIETNPEKRRALVTEALLIHKNEFHYLPLHRQVIPWATRSNVTAPHRADNQVIPYRVSVQ
jgi:ABC-type transport system substrate-binding protein